MEDALYKNNWFLEQYILARSAMLECIAWGLSATGDCETSDPETSDTKTGDKETRESKISLFRGLETFHLLKIEH